MNIFDPHITGSLSVSASANIQGDLIVGGTIYGTALSGSFTGSFVGDGSKLVNVPASAVQGLSLNRISDGAVTASIGNGKMTLNANFEPDLTDTRDLGSPTKQWRDLFLSSGSLYINGQQVISTTGNELRITTDEGESIKIIETASDTITLQTENGDITLTSSGNGNIELDAPIQIGAGKKILSSDGNSISFANGLVITGSIVLSGDVDGVDVARLKTDVDAILSGSSADKNSFAEIVGLINSVDTTNDQAFASHYTASNSKFSSIESTTASFDGRLDSIEVTTGSLSGRIGSLESESGSIRTTFNTYTSSNNTTNTNQNNRLNSLETTTGSIITVNNSQNGRLDSIESFTASIDDTYATDEDVNSVRGDFNTYTSSNNTTNSAQNGRLNSLETKSGSVDLTLGNFGGELTSLDRRLDSIETFTGSLDDTFATDEDVTTLRGTLNTYTSSNNTKNNQQDGRLDSLEGFTASIDDTYATDEDVNRFKGDFNTYTSSNNTSNSNQNNRLSALETKSGSVDTLNNTQNNRLNSLETTTGSIIGVNNTQNSRLTSIESTTSSLDGRLDTIEGGLEFTGSNVTIKGDLLVKGETVRINSTEIDLGDNIISLNGTGATNGGIKVNDGPTSGSLLWDGTRDYWVAGREGSEERIITDGPFHTYTSSLNSKITSIHSTTASFDGRLDSIESFTSSINDTYATDEDVNRVRGDFNTYTSSNNTTNTTQNNRLNSIETTTGSIIGVNNTQNNRLNSLETKTGSLDNDISTLDGRLDSIESFTGSINDTYATDEDVTRLRGDFNSHTNSVNNTLNNESVRINGLELFTASIDEDVTTLRGDLNTYTSSNNTTNNTQNNRLGSLETSRTSFNSFTSSIGVTIKDKLNNERVISGSSQVVLNDADKTGFNTTDVPEGTNLYYTDARVKSKLSGEGVISGSLQITTLPSVDTDDLSEGTTNLYFTNNRVDSRINSKNVVSGSEQIDVTRTTNYSVVGNKLSSLETTSGSHNTRLNTLESFKTTIETGIELTGSNVTIKGNLLVKGTETRVNSTTVDVSDNIISLNGTGASNAGIEVRDVTSPGILSGSLIWDGLENQWKGGTKGAEERILLERDLTTLDGRLDSLETQSGSIRTTFNSYTSSNNTTNTTQNNRLNSLESATGSYTTTDYYTTGATFDNTTGVIRGTRNDGGSWTVDIDGRYLQSHPTVVSATSSNNSGRTYIQDILLDGNGHVTGLTTATETVVNTDTIDYVSDVQLTENILRFSSVGRGFSGDIDLSQFIDNTNTFLTGATFNSSNGVVTLTKNDGTTVTVDLDGRYLTAYTETDTLATVTSRGSSTTSTIDITAGNILRGFNASGGSTVFHQLETYWNTNAASSTATLRFDVGLWRLWSGIYGGYVLNVRSNGNVEVVNNVTASSFIKTGGTSTQFLKADGSVDANTYLTAHPSVSAASSSNNSGRTYIQDILLDSFGHITGLTTATETVVNTDRYVTGATFNNNTADLTLTRNDGNTVTVRLLDTLSDVTVTGGTYNSGTQTLRLTKSDGSTVDVSGFAIDTDVNWYTTGATFNASNGVITGTRNDGGTWTVDIDGRYLTSYTETDTLNSVVARGNTTSYTMTIGPTLTVQADNSANHTASRIWLKSHNDYRGAGTFMSSTDTTWYAGTPYTGFKSEYIISRVANPDDESTANPSNSLFRLNSSGNLTITGTFSASGYNKTNWDTAYGWGNHSGLYLGINSKAADSNLLDGIDSSSFLRSNVVDATVTGTILSTNNANVDGANFEVNTTNKSVNEYAYKVSRSGGAVGGIYIDGRGEFPSLTAGGANITSTTVSNWNTAYGWGNHSGLYLGINSKAADSNLLDGIDSSSFLRSDANDTFTADYLGFSTLSLGIANNNSPNGYNTYFRGDSTHFVLGLTNGNTLYLNYGNSSGTIRTFGTWNHEGTEILSSDRTLSNVRGNISMFTNDSGYITSTASISGNAATSSKWATARTITLSGDLSGSVSIDGSANVTLSAEVANDSHTHDGRYFTETESDARYPLSRGGLGTSTTVGDTTGWGNNLAAGTYTRGYVGHGGQVIMSHDTGGSVGNVGIEVTYYGSMYVHTNVDSSAWVTKQIWTSENFTSTKISNWDTAYGWGDHSTRGYLTAHPSVSAATSVNNSGRTYIQDILLDSFGHITGITSATETVVNTDTNYYTTGSTFNSGTGIITFTRNDGNTYTVNIAATLTDVTVTGGTYNSGTQTLRLTKSNGTTVDVSGFAVDTDVNWYTTSASFNTGNGIITGTRNDGGTWTVDIDGRFVPYSGGNMTGDLNWGTTGTGLTWTMNTDGAYIKFYNTGDGDTDSRLEYGTSDNGNEYHRWMISTVEEMTLKSDGLRVRDSIWMGGNLVATESWVSGRGYLTVHPTIAGVSSNNSGRTYIQDVLTDTNGHVTGLTTSTETVVNTDTNYYVNSASFSSGVLTLTRIGLGSLAVNLDGRYLQTESDTLATVTSRGATTNSAITIGGTLTINKSGTDSYIVFPAQTNDAGYIRHYESNNTSRMLFSVSDDSGTTDYFGFGYNTDDTRFVIYSNGNIYGKGTAEFDGTIYADSGLHVRGDWVRVNGSNGLYFEDYGGGWRMTGTAYVEMYGSKSLHMQNGSIDYVTQLHFNDNVRFYDEGNNQYLNYKWGNSGAGGIKFVDGDNTLQGYVYGSGTGSFGLLDSNGDWRVRVNTTEVEHYSNTYVTTLYANLIYDRNNTAYFLNPAGESNLNTLTLNSTASGTTVFNIQGTQGQLFSITDDLTGDLFSVSDASGVPIFNVNANGNVNVDSLGSLTVGGVPVLTAHPSVTTVASSNNSGRTYIQDILLDSFGHITGITTATETVVNTDTNTVTSVGISGDLSTGNITFVGAGATTVTKSGGTITITSTDTNTDTDRYVNSASFNTGDGVLTLTRAGSDTGTVTVDLDGRYIQNNTSIDITSGVYSFRSQNNGASTTGDQATIEIHQDDANQDAFMQFHISGDYAVYFGLDGSTNDLFVGGWSMGAVKNKIYHAGNLTNLNQLTNGPGYITGNQTITLSGDATGSGTTSIAVTVDKIDGRGFRNTGDNDATNADTINSNGITYYTGGVTNFSGNSSDGALYSQAYSSVWQHQIAGDYRSGQIAVRGKNNNTWQAWKKVALVNSTTFTNVTSVSFTHGLGTDNVIVQVYDGGGSLFFPSELRSAGGVVTAQFVSARSGRIVVTG